MCFADFSRKYLNTSFDKYLKVFYTYYLFYEKIKATIHFWKQKNDSCDMEQLNLKIFGIHTLLNILEDPQSR